ncbi:MAG: (Fe-S)-binding protein [Gammaproteobacteria bacterium]|nr:(Fe-S)-binding protein [Gammaproteobacteria bacterium]MYJ51935.1 (Fe-S)-binding protein [Gammaproteobacteria bacterium]
MKAEFNIPVVTNIPRTPSLEEGAMAHSRPFVAGSDHQGALGFPGELVEDWHDRALGKMKELLGKYRSLQVFMDACVKCGACTDKCHYYLGTADPKNMPVARQDLMRKVYRRYFTFAGKYFPWLVGAVDLTREVLEDWYSYYHQCSECRRCSVYCPYGIDTAEITMAGREILASVGIGQKYSNEIIGKVFKIGNNLGLPKPAMADTLLDLEEEIKDDTDVDVRLPLDEEGAEILLVTPSADFFAEPHVDGLIGYAKVFHQAGIRWTLSSHASEAANFGLFIGNDESMEKVASRIREAALELGVRRIVVGECGHAWRVAYSYWNTLIGPFDFLDPDYPAPQHVCEVTHDLIERGALRFNREKNDDKVVTFHDSCNVSRGSRMGNVPGGQFTIPRALIRASCNHFVDMREDSIREGTFCCGGGGGLLTDDLTELRVKGALPRVQALHEVIERHGVTHMAAICAICKSQFTKVLPFYSLGMDMIVSVHQLVGDALELGVER